MRAGRTCGLGLLGLAWLLTTSALAGEPASLRIIQALGEGTQVKGYARLRDALGAPVVDVSLTCQAPKQGLSKEAFAQCLPQSPMKVEDRQSGSRDIGGWLPDIGKQQVIRSCRNTQHHVAPSARRWRGGLDECIAPRG